MTLDVSRRGLIVGLGCVFAAPAIVRASSLMKVKPLGRPWAFERLPTRITIQEWIVVDDQVGDDAMGTGTYDNPFRTLAKGVELARPGDTIILNPLTAIDRIF